MSRPLEPQEHHKEYYKMFELNLKYYRSKLKMTQAQVADRAGISTKYLSLLESAFFENSPSIEVVLCLADALQVAPYKLFKQLS